MALIRLSTGRSVPAEEGISALEALRSAGIYLVSTCGGEGTCGKCRVRLLEGDAGPGAEAGAAREGDEPGMVLACQSYPEGDILIEIPERSRLVVGEKIAVARAESLSELFGELGAGFSPLVKNVPLKLPPPSLDDNISDIERIKRALEEEGITGVTFPHGFVSSVGQALRDAEWEIDLWLSGKPVAVAVTPRTEGAGLGVAVDLGTTTVVAYLVDLVNGKLVDVGTTYNSQIRYGDDVITRIVFATEGGGLGELRQNVVQDVNNLLGAMLERHGLKGSDVRSAVLSGNTTMAQLFWGIDPKNVREEPYIPTLNAYPKWNAETAGIEIHPAAPVYTLPSVASYVGGDIVSGVLASKMHRNPEVALFMDIGTNGEIAIGNNEWLVTAACSAGPCFEGSGIVHGMRATEGAIESVGIDPETFEPTLGIIDGDAPIGICGSGMIDAIGEMFLTGIIDQKGKFIKDIDTWRLREAEHGLEYVFCKGREDCGAGDVSLTEPDIENILRAKAAIYAGVTVLLDEVGLTLDAIERVYIAGGFGNFLDVKKAITLGMLPDMPVEKYSFIGNSSVSGAYLCLLSGDMRKEAGEIASRMTYIELSVSRGFMDEYVSALFLPHTDINRFPTVKGLLEARK